MYRSRSTVRIADYHGYSLVMRHLHNRTSNFSKISLTRCVRPTKIERLEWGARRWIQDRTSRKRGENEAINLTVYLSKLGGTGWKSAPENSLHAVLRRWLSLVWIDKSILRESVSPTAGRTFMPGWQLSIFNVGHFFLECHAIDAHTRPMYIQTICHERFFPSSKRSSYGGLNSRQRAARFLRFVRQWRERFSV